MGRRCDGRCQTASTMRVSVASVRRLHGILSTRTLTAQTEQGDIVRFDLKARWHHRMPVGTTFGDVEHPLALPALEVVVVSQICKFVAWRFARQADFADQTVAKQRFDVAIDRCQSERRGVDSRKVMKLSR